MRPNKVKTGVIKSFEAGRKNKVRRADPGILKRFLTGISALTNGPFFNVAALVVLFLSVLTGVRCLRSPERAPQLDFVERPGYEDKADNSDERLLNPSRDIFSGEVYFTSIRLRETGALGMAMSLAVFAEFSEKGRMPSDLESVWQAVQSRNLLPPGLRIENGQVISETSNYRVHFQSQPLKFEILSISQDRIKSPALLLQFPLASFDGKTVTYFQSISADHYNAPAPFAPPEQIVSDGWTIEQWRSSKLAKADNLLADLAEEKQKLAATGASH